MFFLFTSRWLHTDFRTEKACVIALPLSLWSRSTVLCLLSFLLFFLCFFFSIINQKFNCHRQKKQKNAFFSLFLFSFSLTFPFFFLFSFLFSFYFTLTFFFSFLIRTSALHRDTRNLSENIFLNCSTLVNRFTFPDVDSVLGKWNEKIEYR